ncbi:hypothetical protein [Caballeronia sp. RCC_10]|uniref:SLOG domain-containing protein n=1 Tax=Caballeronia sp. RCC_10 TaxID=3239227 RepID=UPI0035249B23
MTGCRSLPRCRTPFAIPVARTAAPDAPKLPCWHLADGSNYRNRLPFGKHSHAWPRVSRNGGPAPDPRPRSGARFCNFALVRCRIVWGGHPSIAPMTSAACGAFGVQYATAVTPYLPISAANRF